MAFNITYKRFSSPKWTICMCSFVVSGPIFRLPCKQCGPSSANFLSWLFKDLHLYAVYAILNDLIG